MMIEGGLKEVKGLWCVEEKGLQLYGVWIGGTMGLGELCAVVGGQKKGAHICLAVGQRVGGELCVGIGWVVVVKK